MGIAVEHAEKTFDDYLAYMTPYVESFVSKQAHTGYLDRDDLIQEALRELWNVWRKLHGKVVPPLGLTKPEVEFDRLCKIGSKAIKEIMISSWQRSRTRGQGNVSIVYLDEVTPNFDRSRHDTIPDSAGDVEASLEFRMEFNRYCSGRLTDMEYAVLREFLHPSEDTLREMEKITQTCKSRRTHVSIRNEGVALSLGIDRGKVGATWRKLQALVAEFIKTTSEQSR